MRACFLVIAAVSAVEPPVISLDLSASSPLHVNTSMWSGESSIYAEGHSLKFTGQNTGMNYGVSVGENSSILYKHARITDENAMNFENSTVKAHRDLTLRCAADLRRTSDSCVLPVASATDHHDSGVTVKSRIYHIRNNDGQLQDSENPVTTVGDGAAQNAHGWHCTSEPGDAGGANCITRTLTAHKAYIQRGSWLIRYDAKDSSGNRAEQLVVALTLDDHTKPQWSNPVDSPPGSSSENQFKCPLDQQLKAWHKQPPVGYDRLCRAGQVAPFEYSEDAFDNVAETNGTLYSVTDTTRYDVEYNPSPPGHLVYDTSSGNDNSALNDGETAAKTAYDKCGSNCTAVSGFNFCASCTAVELQERLGDPRTKTGRFVITVKIHDHAGEYGVDGKDNTNSYLRTVEVKDSTPPTITLRTNANVSSSAPGVSVAADCVDVPGKNSKIPLGSEKQNACCSNAACSEVYQQCGYVYSDNFATVQDDFDDHCSDLNAQAASNSDQNLTNPAVGFPVAGSPPGSYDRLYECMSRTAAWTYLVPAQVTPSSGLQNDASADTTGDYTITFSTRDNNMNAATDVNRVVHVIDTVPPSAQLYPLGVDEVVHFASSDPGHTTNFTKYGNGSRTDSWMNPDTTCEMNDASQQPFENTKELNATLVDANLHSCSEPGIVCYDFCDSKESSGGRGHNQTDLLVTAKWVEFSPHVPSGAKQNYSHGEYGVSRECNDEYPCEYDDRVVGKWVRSYTCTDRSGNYHTVNRSFVNADKDRPQIVLFNGVDNTQDTAAQHISRYEAAKDAVYTEPGATCQDWHRHDIYDPNDGNVLNNGQQIIDTVHPYNVSSLQSHPANQAHLVITQVDPEFPHSAACTASSCPATDVSKPGTYVMKYTCTDHAGNEADAKFRTVIVVDDIKPVLSLKNDSKCDPPNKCTVEAGFKFVDPGIIATDANNMGSLGAGPFPLRNVSLDVTFFNGLTVNNADGHGGVKALLDTMDPVMGTGATLLNPQVGEYVLTYNVEDFWHIDTVTLPQASSPCSGYNASNGITCNVADPVKRTLTVTDSLRPVITLHDGPYGTSPFHTSDATDTGVWDVQNPAGRNASRPIAGAYQSGNPNISLMAKQDSYLNGWIVAGVVSAVAGVALLVQGNKKGTSVPV